MPSDSPDNTVSSLRLRMKIWVHPETQKRFMVAAGYLELKSERMIAYAMSDEQTYPLKLTIDEWNALPYFFFREDGPAPKPEKKYDPDPFTGGPIVRS